MNKQLFEKVKDLCKDTGLSEKYLKAITEKMGGSVEDDSTDEAAIETCANLIADVAKESQGEAYRWANKKKDPKKDSKPKDDDDGGDPNKKDPDTNAALLKRIEDMGKELKELKDGKAKNERAKTISELMAKHKIPSHLQERLAKSISDDEDAETVISGYKQDLISNGLPTEDSEGSKAASGKQIDEAADSLLETIIAK